MSLTRPVVLTVALTAAVLLIGLPATSAPVLEKTVDNAALAQTFRNPVNPGADPSLFYYGGRYHVATTTGDHIGIWSSPSLATLLAAPEKVVWRDTDTSRNTQLWALAFRHVGSRWYIYYTASDGVDANHRMYVVESAGDDRPVPTASRRRSRTSANTRSTANRSPTTASSTSPGPDPVAAKVALLSVVDAGNGIAGISIDGGPEQRVDYYSSLRVGEQLVYVSPTLPAGQHTLKVRVTGDKNPSSSSSVISLDRIETFS